MGAVAHVCVHYPTGRKKQAAARDGGFGVIIPKLVGDGVDELLIESRRDLDERDRLVIEDTLGAMGCPDAFAYDWFAKSEPLLWFADAICGAVYAYLLNENDATHYKDLCSSGVITEPVYINETSP
jgi:hypothetical protein